VLHVGLAGARLVPVGSLVVGTEAVYCDLSAKWPVVDRAHADPMLVDAIRAVIPDAPALPIHTSAAVGGTCDAGSDGALVEAMEGFGVLRAAALAGVPAVEVRVVSNEIGEPDRERWGIDAALRTLADVVPSLARAVAGVEGRPHRDDP
jgi:futalosine hydrolase